MKDLPEDKLAMKDFSLRAINDTIYLLRKWKREIGDSPSEILDWDAIWDKANKQLTELQEKHEKTARKIGLL